MLIYQEIRSTRLNHKLSKFHLETFSSVHVFDVRLFRAIKGVLSLLTLAYFFTEKSRCQDAHPQPPFYEWTGKAVARGVSIVSLVGIYF